MTSIDLSFPPSHDQYCVPEYPNGQNKAVAWDSRRCKQRMLTPRPSLTFCPHAVYWTQWAHMRLPACRRVGWWVGGGCLYADMWGPAQVDMCLCVCVLVGSEGKQQSGRVAMRPSGNWMTRSAFLAEPVWKVAVRGACFCPGSGPFEKKVAFIWPQDPCVWREKLYFQFHFEQTELGTAIKVIIMCAVADILVNKEECANP